jgi:hypothetical protein
MRLSGELLGRADAEALLGAAIVLSNGALLLALAWLYTLVCRTEGSLVAHRTVLCLLAFPTSFFLSAVYPESLFLAVAVGAFVYALKGRWALVGVLGALAALSKSYGVLITLPVAWEYLTQHRWRLGWGILWLALIPAGFLAWLTYLVVLSGDPLVLVHAQEQWARRLWSPWEILRHYLSFRYWRNYVALGGAVQDSRSPIDLAFALLLFGLVVLTWRLRRWSLALFATLLYLPMISTGIYQSIPRYGLELFPVFAVLGQMTIRRGALALYLLLAGTISVVLMARFALGWWVA